MPPPAETPGLRDASPWGPERLARLWPDRIALVDPDRNVPFSYPQLRDRALAVASGLKELAVRPGDRVGAIAPNGVELLDLLFACARLRAIFVPYNWRLSRREIQGLVADTQPSVMVAGAEFVEMARAVSGSAQLVSLDESCSITFPQLLRSSGQADDACPVMADPWLVLYTGGTTGIPKGAVLTHGSITWNSINTVLSWGMGESDIGPNFTPMFHTGGFNVFTLPLLLFGGRVILPERFDPGAALRIIEEEKPTVLFMVPTMFQLVAEHPDFETTDFSSLRWAISGGAPLPPPVYSKWKSRVPVFKQGYGLTEAGPNNFATPDIDADRKRGSVGRLTYFAQARIVDDAGADVPEGAPGELLLAGPHMCAGYWNRPDATREAIRDGWLHTGDVARRDAEGYYYIVDRKKDMIITGGENVFPAEVEAVLYGHRCVREAAVVGIPHAVWGEAVTAVISLKPNESASVDELRRYTRDNLARYKVPKEFVIVDDVPKSAAGKILRSEAKKLALSRTAG